MKTVTLGEVADWGSGGTPKRNVAEYFGEGVPWLSIADLNNGVVTCAKESLTAGGVANSSAKVVPTGTLFVAMYGSIGKVGIAGREMCTSQAIAFAKPRPEIVDPRYLFRYLLSQQRALQALGRGGTQMNIRQGDLKAWPITLPSLGEQRRIAAILDHTDALRAKRRQVLAHLATLPQSIFYDMFGEAEPTVTVGDVAEIQGGLQVSAKRADLPIEVPYLRVANAHRGRLDLSEVKALRATPAEIERTKLVPGDLLFVEGHANPLEVGRVAIWTGQIDGCVHQNHLIRGRFDRRHVLPNFAATWFNSDRGAAHFRRAGKTTSGLNTIRASTVRTAPLPAPPVEGQREFAVRVERVSAQRAAVQRALAADDELVASLQARAFRGEL